MSVFFALETEEMSYRLPENPDLVVRMPVEIRRDPLTGETIRLVRFKKFSLPKLDWHEQAAATKALCPFCPGEIDSKTPCFTEDISLQGRIKKGEATVVPNLSPYERYTAVTVMAEKHWLDWPELTAPIIRNAFTAASLFLKSCLARDPEGARYCSINWNYMPYSGGTLIHPHLQVLAGPRPTNYQRRMEAGVENYQNSTGGDFFQDLLQAEIEKAERYLGRTGDAHWISSFAPQALAEVTAITSAGSLAGVGEELFSDLARGMEKVILYYHRQNIPSFNAALYLFTRPDIPAVLRMAGRFPLIPPAGSDMSYLQVLHQEPWTLWAPESVAEELKDLF